MTQGVGGGGGLFGVDGEANPQPTAAVMCNRSRLLVGLHVEVRRKASAASRRLPAAAFGGFGTQQ